MYKWLFMCLISLTDVVSIFGATPSNLPAQLPLFFWDARPKYGFENFGDALSQVLVEKILGYKVQIASNPYSGQKKMLGMGSILNYAQDDDVLWGTGINGKTPLDAYHFSRLEVRAVRGPLTRQFLLDRGIPCPEVYGDPTLLLPYCFPEFQKSEHPSRDYLIIPHFSDEYLFSGHPNMLSVKENWETVIRAILDSRFVISSALSGVIVAEAFGIPARLLIVDNSANTENLVKYEDYYQGTQRATFKYAISIEEALEMGGEPMPVCDFEKLYDAFPFEYFK
jgi:pyruvyltransferase